MCEPNPTVDLPEADTISKVTLEAVPAPEYIGRYRIERLLGRGGFGVVWLAYDEQLSRSVAIKVPHAHHVVKPGTAQAYLTEARTVASLDHPNIVPVYDVGSTDRYPCYIVSKFIDGCSLTGRLQQSRVPLADAVELSAVVAEALQHAHGQGLVHRDIKPGNILLDKSGRPFVTDFGLALREQDLGTGPGYVGTLGYMSPEQARGEGHRVDGRSDIFSLGVVLYQLLTGERPFHAQHPEQLLEEVSRVALQPPRQRDETIPKELERICLKALAKRVADRYASAYGMASDLRHFQQAARGGSWAAHVETKAAVAVSVTQSPTLAAALSASDLPPSTVPRIVPKGLRSFDGHDADFFLELLPGPRDRDGLPDSLRFWKNRIEETDADDTFAVGLIYGPSGCGKSSLVKAGLLPRLARDVIPVYVEATSAETETRLLNGIRKKCPALPAELGLTETLAALRRGLGLAAGKKVLLVLDQFEQWLHADAGRTSGSSANPLLVDALRQCDGSHVQCLLLVRDDFWLAVSRFLRELEVQLLEGHNSALVDLFDTVHARQVLAAFGRAFGKLPANPRETSKEGRQFLEQAVAGLTDEGKVICVRLALFAEMMKNKPWTPASLRAVGGMAGVGVTFLEETFSAATAPAAHRYHQRAVRSVLQALAPETGTDIKGHMRSQADVLAASGYAGRPKDFADLLGILDGEVRLITPTDPHGMEDSITRVQPGEKCYQLTHDYLVHSLREWLARKQKETRRGRAELLLADRANDWSARPEKRLLPTLTEWLRLRLLTSPRSWSAGQRQMMQGAARKHLARLGSLVLVLVVIIGAGVLFTEHLAEERATADAHAMVRRLMDAQVSQAPKIIEDMRGYRRWVEPALREVLADPRASRDHQLHARLALLPADSSQVPELSKWLLEADALQFPIIRDALGPHSADLVPDLWLVLATNNDSQRRFRAACALASYAPTNRGWTEYSRWVAEHLVAQPALVLPHWVEALRPVHEQLLPALLTLIRERTGQPAASAVVAEVLGAYAAQQPRILAAAVADATPSAFLLLFPHLQAQPPEAQICLTALLDQLPPDEGPAANDTARQRVNLAIALLRLGKGERLWPLLRASSNPRARSFAIDRFAALGCRPDDLIPYLDKEPDATVRAALWQGLGSFDDQALPESRRRAQTTALVQAFKQDPSAAVHAATYWLLQKWGLPVPDCAGEERFDWYVNSAGQAMIRLGGPVKFQMGAAPDEPGRSDLENRHEATIDHAFDIGMTEVTIGQFRPFLQQRDGGKVVHPGIREGLPDDAPITKVSWYEAVAYCNWLSAREGIPVEDRCYEANSAGRFGDGMTIAAHYTRKPGYRLPTEAEWEYACRGGAATSRCYGDADELLPRYAWTALNATDEPAPVGKLLANAFGLFDMHGNTSEWCQNGVGLYSTRAPDDSMAEIVTSGSFRALRGGGIFSPARMVRSARRFGDRPTVADTGGFRLARSRP